MRRLTHQTTPPLMPLLTPTLLPMPLAIRLKMKRIQWLTIIHTTELLEIQALRRKGMMRKRSPMSQDQPNIRTTTRTQVSKFSSLLVSSPSLAPLPRSTLWPTIPRKLRRNRLRSLPLRNYSNKLVQLPMPRTRLRPPRPTPQAVPTPPLLLNHFENESETNPKRLHEISIHPSSI